MCVNAAEILLFAVQKMGPDDQPINVCQFDLWKDGSGGGPHPNTICRWRAMSAVPIRSRKCSVERDKALDLFAGRPGPHSAKLCRELQCLTTDTDWCPPLGPFYRSSFLPTTMW